MKSINENTLIPLGLAVITIGGGAIWLTQLSVQTRANAEILDKIQQDRSIARAEYLKNVEEIKVSLAEIKVELKIIRGKNGN